MKDAAVIGGGIGGLAAALGLRHAGLDVLVLEKEPGFREVGAGLELGPNGSRILSEWGLLAEMEELGVQPKALIIKDAITGVELTRLDLGAEFIARYGSPYLVGHRSDLLNILLQANKVGGVELRPDAPVATVESLSDFARITTEQGHRYDARIAIGADGLNSTVRSDVVQDALVASGYVAYRGTSPTDAGPVGADVDNVVLHIGPGCHFVQYLIRKGNGSHPGLLNQVAVFRSPAYLRGEENWGLSEEVDEAFAQCLPSIRAALTFVPRDRRWLMYDRDPIKNWVSGRLLLLGDAAHPMLQYLAQGACQALEDGWVLQQVVERSGERGRSGDDWQAISTLFNAVREARTTEVQLNARAWGESWHVDGIGRTMRNLLFSQRRIDDYHYVDWLYAEERLTSRLDPPHTPNARE